MKTLKREKLAARVRQAQESFRKWWAKARRAIKAMERAQHHEKLARLAMRKYRREFRARLKAAHEPESDPITGSPIS